MSGSSEFRGIERRAFRLVMLVTEIPVMVFVGYLLGHRFGREADGILLGAIIGTILLVASVWASAIRRR